jgi:O-antigen biosynthesis protein
MDFTRYVSEIDLDNPEDSHVRLVEMVGTGKRVIDVGCSTGFVSQALKERGCTVTGIEVDPEAARLAEGPCEKVIVADLDQVDLTDAVGAETFDVALFGDVIEHLKNPARLLKDMRGLLAPDGYIVVSVPNVAHASVRLALLKGQFDYEDTGILDETHLKYYTRSSIGDLLESCGYMVEVMDWTELKVSAEEVHEVLDPLGLANLEEVVKAFSEWEAVAFQYIVKAFPATEEAQVRKLSEEKVQAERQLKVLEKEAVQYRKVERQLEDALSEIEKSAAYVKTLEKMIADKDGFIAQLQQAVAESRTRLEDCEAKMEGMAAAFKELEGAQSQVKRRRKL